MASKNSSTCHTRSASYPPKTNPMVQKIEQELKKLSISEASSSSDLETISIGLSGLASLYKCVHDVLNLLLTHNHQLLKALPLLLGSISTSTKLVEICSASNQILITLKEAVSDLKSALASDTHSQILENYLSSRKDIMRRAKGVASTLRQLELEAAASLLGDHQQVLVSESAYSEVSRVMTCVTIINISVLQSLLQLLAAPMSKKPKSNKIALLSKMMMSKKTSKLAAEGRNELINVDAALPAVFCGTAADADTILMVHKRLEVLELALNPLEDGLTTVFRGLSKTRTALLNLISV